MRVNSLPLVAARRRENNWAKSVKVKFYAIEYGIIKRWNRVAPDK